MSYEQNQNDELMMEGCLIPALQAAVRNWQKARLAFQNIPGKECQDCYCKATDELGQAIS
jgi:hypothetical protein